MFVTFILVIRLSKNSALGWLIAEEGKRRLLYFFVLSFSMLGEDKHFTAKFWIVREKIQNPGVKELTL